MDGPTKPKFKTLLEESDWWDSLSMEEILAMSEPDDEFEGFIDARPKKAVSLRLTEALIADGKVAAKELGLGYQTLFRIWITEGLRRHKRQKIEEAASRKRKSE